MFLEQIWDTQSHNSTTTTILADHCYLSYSQILCNAFSKLKTVCSNNLGTKWETHRQTYEQIFKLDMLLCVSYYGSALTLQTAVFVSYPVQIRKKSLMISGVNCHSQLYCNLAWSPSKCPNIQILLHCLYFITNSLYNIFRSFYLYNLYFCNNEINILWPYGRPIRNIRCLR